MSTQAAARSRSQRLLIATSRFTRARRSTGVGLPFNFPCAPRRCSPMLVPMSLHRARQSSPSPPPRMRTRPVRLIVPLRQAVVSESSALSAPGRAHHAALVFV
eukprot:15436882-Alexandrium_andersonii.AAC.1